MIDERDDAAEPAEADPGPAAGGPTAQSELDLGVVSTGSAEVDAALRPLEGLGERAVPDHPDVFESVLAELTETMTTATAETVASAESPEG